MASTYYYQHLLYIFAHKTWKNSPKLEKNMPPRWAITEPNCTQL